MQIKNIIFDLGGVLIDWNPRYMYSTIFQSTEKMEYFLAHVTTSEWNEAQDAGRSIAEAVQIKIAEHPDYKLEIEAYYSRWTEMLNGAIQPSVEILKSIQKSKKYRLLALTNWSAETFPYALEHFDFLQIFEGILVSGTEKLIKPDSAIYQLLLDRYDIKAHESIFIDDNYKNIIGAQSMGINAVHFQNTDLLKQVLKKDYSIDI